MRVALAGNPNVGKTTLFNTLTGLGGAVGNYPGTTVEARWGRLQLPDGSAATVCDLPGCYSLAAEHGEQPLLFRVLAGLVDGRPPDVVVAVVDPDHLARSLYLVQQLQEMEVPLVVAVNAARGGQLAAAAELDVAALAAQLRLPAVALCARGGEGVEALAAAVAAAANTTAAFDSGRLPGLDDHQRQMVAALREDLAAPSARQAGLPLPSLGASLWLLSRPPAAAAAAALPGLAGAQSRLAAEGGPLAERLARARFARADAWARALVPAGGGDEGDTLAPVDRLLLHPVGGLAALAVLLVGTLQGVFLVAAPLVRAVEEATGWAGQGAALLLPPGPLQELVRFGVLAGIANVLAFVPQIALLFAALTVLEESGYLARAAFVLDGLMRRLGVQGQAFVPLITSVGCAVPGLLATRALASPRDRLATMLVAPWVGCSARLPVYAMVVGAFFADRPPVFGVLSAGACLVASMFALGLGAAGLGLWLLRRHLWRGPRPGMIMELPPLRLPQGRDVVLRAWSQARGFVAQTGKVIVLLSVVLWGLMSFPRHELPAQQQAAQAVARQAIQGDELAASERRWRAQARAWRLEHSLAGQVGHALEPVLAPLGFDWRVGVALVASFAAREVLVSALGQVYALDAADEPDAATVGRALASAGPGGLTPLTGVGLMVFFALALQCSSTVATMRRETGGWRWPAAQLVVMNGAAYLACWATVHGGRALGWR